MGNVTFDATNANNKTVSFSMAASPQLDYIVTTTAATAPTPLMSTTEPAPSPPTNPTSSSSSSPSSSSVAGNGGVTSGNAAAAAAVASTAPPDNGKGVDNTAFFDILENFLSWVGTSPALPDWTLGYWHSKNRYASQDALLEAARGTCVLVVGLVATVCEPVMFSLLLLLLLLIVFVFFFLSFFILSGVGYHFF